MTSTGHCSFYMLQFQKLCAIFKKHIQIMLVIRKFFGFDYPFSFGRICYNSDCFYSQMAKELHHSVSSSLLEKEPLNDIPEDNEEASTPSEDQILATPELINSHTTVPTIQIQVTCDQPEIKHKASLSTIPEIQVLSDDGSDSDAVFEKGNLNLIVILKCDGFKAEFKSQVVLTISVHPRRRQFQ